MADFTPEQLEAVEAAMKNHCSYFDEISHVITELQKPLWVPKVGQIIVNKADPDEFWKIYEINHQTFNNWRPMTATEIGLEPFEYTPYPPMGHETQLDNYHGYCAAIDHVNKTLFGDTE